MIKYKKIQHYIYYLLLLIILNQILVPNKIFASDNWLDYHWQYRKAITVTNNTEQTLSDIQIKLILDSTNFNFSQAQTQGQDLRFTLNDGLTLIPHWIEYYDIGQPKAKIRIRLNNLIPNQSQIYLYYSNPQATSSSSGKDTFLHFQDYNSFNPTIKFGIITDIHHDSNDNQSWTTPDFSIGMLNDARPRLNTFITNMNNWSADFIIELGDLITSENFTGGESVETSSQASTALTQIESTYSNFQGPRYYCHGNHEFYSLSESSVNNLITAVIKMEFILLSLMVNIDMMKTIKSV
jgi:uncharacterized protein DUF2341/calcineurin-like phosphoesterase family protein